ncbi:MAG: DUF4846 domain-containing protein [Ekhidna sp.]|nr:DUF4846 domain-containing protein [Ekhidna sp.]
MLVSVFSIWSSILAQESSNFLDHDGATVKTRFRPPDDFVRKPVNENSFGDYLRNLPLKKHNSPVKYFDGTEKPHDVFEAVVDLPIGNRDLHQCADAIIRLRADYLRSQGKFGEIHFNLTNGFRVDYLKWLDGFRIKEKNNKTWWERTEIASNDLDAVYWDYLELVFYFAGSYSLSRELQQVDISDVRIGDVFIYGGFPGHAIIVVDLVVDPISGKKLMQLAQSYMPAQEIQILKNTENEDLSPWFEAEYTDGAFGSNVLFTPEWTFYEGELKRFK